MNDMNCISILPSDEKWLTGGVFYDYSLMEALEIKGIYKLTGKRLIDYIEILKFFRKNFSDKENFLIIDGASIIYLLPIFFFKYFFKFKVITLHMHLQGKKNSLKQRVFKWCIVNISKKIVTISKYSNDELLPKKADLILYPPLKIIENKNLQKNDNKISILFVGSIIKRKNISLLIELINILEEKYQLTICGNIVEKDYYEDLLVQIEEHNISDRVCFTGKVSDDDIIQLYNNADIFVFPSVLEGFGMVNIEAMQLGIPVFASDVGPHREIIENNKDGFLFDIDNIKELKSKIESFMANEELRNVISKNAIIKAEQFIWKPQDIKSDFYRMIDEN